MVRSETTATTQRVVALTPTGLAVYLDDWARRREKVLRLLDLRAARQARQLAGECRRIAAETVLHEPAWAALRGRICTFLEEAEAAESQLRRG